MFLIERGIGIESESFLGDSINFNHVRYNASDSSAHNEAQLVV
jgi:hypothetical protein